MEGWHGDSLQAQSGQHNSCTCSWDHSQLVAHGNGFWVLAPAQDQPKHLSPDLAVALFWLQAEVRLPEPEGEGRP